MNISKLLAPAAAVLAVATIAAPAGAATINGTKAREVLRGTQKADVIRGRAGNDRILGRGGADRVFGQQGNDVLVGGAGRDQLVGGKGNDLIRAADGFADVVSCGPGVDVVVADQADALGRDCERSTAGGTGNGESGGANGGSGDGGSTAGGTASGGGGGDSGGNVPNNGGGGNGNNSGTFPLTVSVSGPGTVTSAPAGIACPGDCAEEYASGALVKLTARPAANAYFGGWSEGCSALGFENASVDGIVCFATMDAAKSLSVRFSAMPRPAQLEVSVAGAGTVTGLAIACSAPNGPSACSASFAGGTTVTLTATPLPSFRFVGWEGDAMQCGSESTCSLALGDGGSILRVTARFAGARVPQDPLTLPGVGTPPPPPGGGAPPSPPKDPPIPPGGVRP